MTSPVVGFRNLAQSCFVNAGIQVFFGVRPLAASFAEGVTEAEAALSRLLARVAEARQPFVPTELTRTYYRGRQEDLAEFVLNILSECAGCHGLLCGQEVPNFTVDTVLTVVLCVQRTFIPCSCRSWTSTRFKMP